MSTPTEDELIESLGSGVLRLRWSRGKAWQFEILHADAVVEFSDYFLEALQAQDRMDVSLGDGIVTFRGVNRTVSYGLGHHDHQRLTTVGHLSG